MLIYMSYIIEEQIIYINSKNKISGSDGSFDIVIDDIDMNIEYDRVTVLDIILPKTYYIIPDGYNYFSLTEDDETVQITIPPGNCTRTSLATIIQSLLNSSSPKNYTYTISYENISQTIDTGKLMFKVTNNGGILPILTFNDSMYEQLGFNKNSSNQFVYDSLNNIYYLKSENVININLESTLFLRSTICQDNNNNILQNIITPLNTSFSYIVFYNQSPYEYSKKFSKNSSNKYNFTIINEDGRIIDFNGANIQITIKLYKRDRTNELLSYWIKTQNLESLSKSRKELL